MLLLLMFTLVYSIFGNPDSEVWSGSYFIVNYIILYMLFKQHRDKYIRIIGISLSASILLFIVLKFFFHLKIDRYYSIVPFTISIIGLLYYEYKKTKKNAGNYKRKNL
jgi:hypothetical protein